MKERICKAFCDTVSTRNVPAGLAVSTTVASINGDPIGFYVVGPLSDGRYRLEDSGLLMPYLQAIGSDLGNQTRLETFDMLLSEHNAAFDSDSLEIVSEPMIESEIPGAALRFVSLLLRVSDLVLMAQDKVVSTFKDDATSRLKERIGESANIREGEPLSGMLSDWEPDLVIKAKGRPPVAVFLVQTEHRILEAMLLHSEALQASEDARVVGMLEREGSISQKTRIRALNRLDAMAVFGSDEQSAINRVATEAIGRQSMLH